MSDGYSVNVFSNQRQPLKPRSIGSQRAPMYLPMYPLQLGTAHCEEQNNSVGMFEEITFAIQQYLCEHYHVFTVSAP